MRDITSYTDYKFFLSDRYDYFKKNIKNFSARYFAIKSNINSPSYIRHIINGKRRLTPKMLDKIAQGLKLSDFEVQYLNILINIERTKNLVKKKNKLKQLFVTVKTISSINLFGKIQLDIFSDPVNIKLHLLSLSYGFKSDISWICEKMGNQYVKDEIESRINSLVNSGIWQINDNIYSSSLPCISSHQLPRNLYKDQLYIDLIKLSFKNLKKPEIQRVTFDGISILCLEEDIPEIQERLKIFKKEIRSEFENYYAGDVFTFSAGFFKI